MRREIHKFEHRRTFAKVALLRVAKNTKTNNHNTRDEEEQQLLSFSLFFSRQ